MLKLNFKTLLLARDGGKELLTETIYKNKHGEANVIRLYYEQLEKLGMRYSDIYVNSEYGETHIIETGNYTGEPLLILHGLNFTSAYNLLLNRFLLEDFHVFAVDILGLPGKSEETLLSPAGYDYGNWAGEIIRKIGYESILCLGCCFGAGVLSKLMCFAPHRIKKSVLIAPAGIKNMSKPAPAKVFSAFVKYYSTQNEIYLKQALMFLSITSDALDEDTYVTYKNSIDNTVTKPRIPANAEAYYLSGCNVPTLVMAGELDFMYPSKQVLKRAKKIIPLCETYEMKGRGHLYTLWDDEKKMIIDFLMR